MYDLVNRIQSLEAKIDQLYLLMSNKLKPKEGIHGDIMSMKEVIKHLKVSRTTIYKWIKNGEIEPMERIGRKLYFSSDEIKSLNGK